MLMLVIAVLVMMMLVVTVMCCAFLWSERDRKRQGWVWVLDGGSACY